MCDGVTCVTTGSPAALNGTDLDPLTAAPVSVTNRMAEFGWEAAWGLHLPGGEESHQTRPLVLGGGPGRPTGFQAVSSAGSGVKLTWRPAVFPPAATAYVIERSSDKTSRARAGVSMSMGR